MSATKRRVKKTRPKKVFNKYDLYLQSVQSPDVDVLFFRKVYKELRKKEPRSLREDFCGTFAICKEWVSLDRNKIAFGIDLDPEPIEYGRQHHLSKLNEAQGKRVHIKEQNVLDPNVPHADIIVALNFSYFLFKTRDELKAYFINVKRSLNKDGLFIVDIFGGSACADENEEKTSYGKFSYFWHQHGFDPVSARAKFSIHFQSKGQKKIEDVFTYDWRMWSIPEIREIMEEVGFNKSHVYWEGTSRGGKGNGVFSRTEHGEECEAWIAYLAGEK
jgi:SAM-dependent methyltransferase